MTAAALSILARDPVTIQNTIVAANTIVGRNTTDFSGVAASLIGNITGTSDWVRGDTHNVDPRLTPLAYNGGPTRTHALFSGGPAIDGGKSLGVPPAAK